MFQCSDWYNKDTVRTQVGSVCHTADHTQNDGRFTLYDHGTAQNYGKHRQHCGIYHKIGGQLAIATH